MTDRHEGAEALSTIRRPQPDPQPTEINGNPGPNLSGTNLEWKWGKTQ